MTMTTRDADGAVLREIDCVTLLCDVPVVAGRYFDNEFEGTLAQGDVGTIVTIADSGDMELEFIVDDTPAFASVTPQQVRLHWRAPEKLDA